MVIMQGQIIKDLMLRLCIVSNTLNTKILRRCLTNYIKKLQKLFFPPSMNQITDLWLFHCYC